ncbi:U3 small nucleolar RNA-associated protein 15 domain-containing protein [Rozella allomycis CSF55]|uniref:U3 small nucleolar RNA-associated protein 15 domain-containing protein n=1 Tax=Rozella allomycis (strain CSF55) TaxID=988480 RepID=A0A075AV79_ROZAC|nr:U3 small nucleolar RNA-associated protein 15 domain-containing protein [Rozella allomycis CSF55]|eukprot:EPZ34148.1 U3 small nucleolar RNA-associated protein 15 domain-containing protein [Rozella allomycis CSF55]
MLPFKKVTLNEIPRQQLSKTPEDPVLKQFKKQTIIKEFSSILDIAVSPVSPHDIALVSSSRVQIFSYHDLSVKKSIAKFKDVVRSVAYRHDGKLIAAADSTGLIQVIEPSKSTILRTLSSHTEAVNSIMYFKDHTQLLSASDDCMIKLWDVPSQTVLRTFVGHTDYVRSLSTTNDSEELFVSGGYDHKMILWDKNKEEPVLLMDHGYPVEAVLLLPGHSIAVSAGGPTVKIWDILAGGKLIHTLNNHQKTVTCLLTDGTRLYTGSLDHHVKVFDLETYKICHSFKYTNPVLSLALDPLMTRFVVGMTNGLISIRQRTPPENKDEAKNGEPTYRANTKRYFARGSLAPIATDAYQVEKRKHKALKDYERFIKKFQYQNALDAAINKGNPEVVFHVIEELALRNALVAALTGRDESRLLPVLKYLMKNVINPLYSKVLIVVTNTVIDMYAGVFGFSIQIDDMLAKLRSKVKEEVELQKRMQELKGMMNLLLNIQESTL